MVCTFVAHSFLDHLTRWFTYSYMCSYHNLLTHMNGCGHNLWHNEKVHDWQFTYSVIILVCVCVCVCVCVSTACCAGILSHYRLGIQSQLEQVGYCTYIPATHTLYTHTQTHTLTNTHTNIPFLLSCHAHYYLNYNSLSCEGVVMYHSLVLDNGYLIWFFNHWVW